jgi:hypothetical protein
MEVGRGPNWGCSAKEKKFIYLSIYLSTAILSLSCFFSFLSRDSAVGIATGYGLDDREVGVRVPVGTSMFPSPRRPDRL